MNKAHMLNKCRDNSNQKPNAGKFEFEWQLQAQSRFAPRPSFDQIATSFPIA